MTAVAGELLCARERGEPPPYVASITWEEDAWTICLAGSNKQRLDPISGTSESELISRCRELAERRVLFPGRAYGWEPADLMSQWQEQGRIVISFLCIAWCGPGEWTVHEVVPDATQWRLVPLDELINRTPIVLDYQVGKQELKEQVSSNGQHGSRE